MRQEGKQTIALGCFLGLPCLARLTSPRAAAMTAGSDGQRQAALTDSFPCPY